VKFLKAPHAFSHLNIATFEFQVLVGGDVNSCTNCSFSCKVSSFLNLHLLLLLRTLFWMILLFLLLLD
jgi:hypothetical protein